MFAAVVEFENATGEMQISANKYGFLQYNFLLHLSNVFLLLFNENSVIYGYLVIELCPQVPTSFSLL